MSIVDAVERREWALPDEFDFDPRMHRRVLERIFREKPLSNHVESPYSWSDEVETRRLLFQNNCLPYSWGDGHLQALLALRDSGFSPQTVFQVGTGPDASLTANLHRVFPDAYLTVVELDGAKVAGAEKKLTEAGYPMQRIKLITGDAVNVLPKLGVSADLIDSQCTIQHLPERGENGRNIPLWWNEVQRGSFLTLERFMETVRGSLRVGGYATLGDLAIDEWDTYAAPGSENDLDVLEKIAWAKKYISDSKMVGWRARGANAWRGAEDIAAKVQLASQGKLQLDSSLSSAMEFKGVGPDHPFTVVTSYIAAVLPSGVGKAVLAHEGALKNSDIVEAIKLKINEESLPRLKKAEQMLWSQGPEYVELLEDPRVCTDLPTLYSQAFRKVA